MSVKITDEIIQEYRRYASDHDIKIEVDEDYVEDLLDACNLHHQRELLEENPDFDCPCEAIGPGQGQDTEFDVRELPPGFIHSTVPQGRVSPH